MPGKMTLVDEVRQDGLFGHRGMAIEDRARLAKRLNEVRWKHEKAKPQGGKERFAEAPHVEHAASAIQTLQRR